MWKRKFIPDLPIETFKDFVRLQDPYENARDKSRRLQHDPFGKQIYVGAPVYDFNPDEPIHHKTSSREFLVEATKSYELVKLDKTARIAASESTQLVTRPSQLRTSEDGRSLGGKQAHWEVLLHRQRVNRVKRSDAKNPLVPRCINWTEEDVLGWLNRVGMGKFRKYEETFIHNRIDGVRFCLLEINRLIQMGIHEWDDLKVLVEEIRKETRRPVRPVSHTRNIAKKPLEDIDQYLEFKNLRGDTADYTSFNQFVHTHDKTVWNLPEKTLKYPGMVTKGLRSRSKNAIGSRTSSTFPSTAGCTTAVLHKTACHSTS